MRIRKTPWNAGLCILLFFTIGNYVPLFGNPSDTTTSITATSISARVLIGVTSIDYAIGFGAEYQFGDELLSMRFVKGVENDLDLDFVRGHSRTSRPLEVASEYSLLYGRGFSVPYGRFTLSMGVSVLKRLERGRLTHWNSITRGPEDVVLIEEHETANYTVFGLPYEIQYMITPTPFGVSLSLFGNVSSRKPIMGFCVSVLLGTTI